MKIMLEPWAIILPCILPELEVVSSLEETERGDNGFGSTGR